MVRSSSFFASFSSSVKPWFYVNENYTYVNVASQDNDPDSILNFYRKAIEYRKTISAIKNGTYKEYFKGSKSVYTYIREDDKYSVLS